MRPLFVLLAALLVVAGCNSRPVAWDGSSDTFRFPNANSMQSIRASNSELHESRLILAASRQQTDDALKAASKFEHAFNEMEKAHAQAMGVVAKYEQIVKQYVVGAR